MKKSTFSLVLALILALSPLALAHTAPIATNGMGGYAAVRLTPQVYNNANGDLSDLLIQDAKGAAVPYFIRTGSQTTNTDQAQYPLELINSYVKDDAFYFDYKLHTMPEQDIVATSIVFTTGATFAKEIDLLGSYDNLNWTPVQQDTLYQIDGVSKLEVTLNEPQKYTHYRLKLRNNLEQIAFTSATLQYNVERVERSYFMEPLNPAFTVKEEGKQTLVAISGIKHLPLAQVILDTDSQFKRNVSLLGVGKQLYNLSFDGVAYQDLTVPMQRYQSGQDTITLAIDNYDDAPIAIKGITVVYYADELIFKNTGGSYTLTFSGDPAAQAPIYDIASYQSEITKGSLTTAKLGAVTLTQAPEPPKEPDYQLWFNVVLLAITAILGAVLILRLRKKT